MALLPSKKTTVPVAELGATLAVKVRASPTRDGFAPAVKVTLTLVLGLLTVCTSAGLTEGLSLLSPVYRAVMECVPRLRSAVLNEAVPLLKGMLPEIVAPPSRNWIEPLPVAGVSVAVNTRLSPKVEGLEPVLNVTARLLAEVRSSTGLFRGFCRTMGQSLLVATKGEWASSMVTAPGDTVKPESPYATAMSVEPSWLKSTMMAAASEFGSKFLTPVSAQVLKTLPSL